MRDFEQDAGNSKKNDQHGVSTSEAEQVFFNTPVPMLPDLARSQAEPRHHAPGKTIDGKRLHVTFTLQDGGKLIRVLRLGTRNANARYPDPGRSRGAYPG